MGKVVKNDNRMGWVRNLEAVDLSKPCSTQEYEFESESRIGGVLNYDDGKVQAGPLSFPSKPTELHRYLLKITYPDGLTTHNANANKKGYAFKEGTAGELLSLLSLHFQSRFYLRASYYGELTKKSMKLRTAYPFRHQVTPVAHNPKILKGGGSRNFAVGLTEFLDSVQKLDEKKHERFIIACWHYARALRDIGIDSEMVFIRLVSAIEVLSESFDLPTKDNPLEGCDFTSIVREENLSKQQLKQLRDTLGVGKDGKVHISKTKARFIGFTNEYSSGCLRGGNWKAHQLKIKRKDVPSIVGKIYDARSAYLHAGEPMYLSHFFLGSDTWDMDPSLGMAIDNKKISGKKKLPYAHWFENLVRCCLLNYLAENSS
ncbi:HEPN domain-containing protein [Parvibaculaceae bacterium PLY_AMNH_Bact1]|nr:HEPN domain-containing protein [Parvibaculaceae bacterium PLY_AMNH_Bact1]